jgi:hypothetical protein
MSQVRANELDVTFTVRNDADPLLELARWCPPGAVEQHRREADSRLVDHDLVTEPAAHQRLLGNPIGLQYDGVGDRHDVRLSANVTFGLTGASCDEGHSLPVGVHLPRLYVTACHLDPTGRGTDLRDRGEVVSGCRAEPMLHSKDSADRFRSEFRYSRHGQ